MATQIKVNSATGNVTVNVSRTAIGQIVNANTANTANALNAASTANVVIGGGLNGYVLATNGAGVTSWVEQTGGGGGAGNPGGSNTQVQYNKEGTFGGDAQFTFNDVTNVLNVGSITATNIGNITPTNLDGNTANYLDGTGTFKPVVAVSATSAEQVVRLCRATETITKGQAVTITGGTGDNPDVSLSNASNASLMPSIGIALENIALNATGNVGLYGELDGIDTTAFTVGDSLFVSATIAGALTDTAPKGESNLIQKIGKVIRVNANGIVMVQGAGRTNQTPNLDAGNIFLGDAFNQATTSTLNTNIVPEGTNLYYTDTRSRLALSTTTATASSGGALAYDDTSGIFTFTPADIASVSDTLADVLVNGNTSSGTDMLMSTTDAIFFRDANTSINSTGVGTLQLNSTVETQITSPYIDLAAANVNMDGNLDITGMFTGDAGGASNIVGANVTGAVPFATTANAVAGSNVSGAVAFATTANSIAIANVAGIGNIAITNYNGVATDVLHGDGTWSADTTTYGNSNVVSLMNVFGSNTINTTGNVTTGNLEVIGNDGNTTIIPDTEVIDGQRFTTVNRATERVTVTAGDFVVGEFYTIATLGTTDFTLVGAFSAVATNTQPGPTYIITSVGTTDFTLVGAASNTIGVIYESTGTASGDGAVLEVNFDATGVGSGTGTATRQNGSSQAFVTENYVSQSDTNFTTYANTAAGHTAKGASFNFTSYNGIGNTGTDPLVPSILSFTAYPQSANLANPITGTSTLFSITQPGADGFFTVVGSGASPGGYNNGAWKQIQYRDNAFDVVRRNGNGDARTSATANDETSFSFYNTQQGFGPGTVRTYNYPAKVGSKVDGDWVDPQNTSAGIKNGLFFQVVESNFNRIDHRMYSNGTVIFNESAKDFNNNPVSTNPVTIGADGVITGDGGGLSNIASANVSGLGNIATINLDGNVANVLRGDGTFNADTTTYSNSNVVSLMNAFGSNTITTTGLITGDGGGLSNVSSVATPGGFFDSVQFNNNGVLGGDSTLTYSTGGKNLTLNGAAAGVGGVPTFNLNNGGFNVNQEEIGGGAATFAFTNYYAGSLIAPTTFFRAQGTRNAPTAVTSGDQILSEGFYVNAGFNGYYGLGSVTATVNSVNADGNASMSYDITTNQSDQYKNDKILLNTSLLDVAGNIRMTGTQDAKMSVKRLYQNPQTLNQLQALVGTLAGERGFITDGTTSGAVNFGGLAVDGGSNKLPVYYDGTDWRFG